MCPEGLGLGNVASQVSRHAIAVNGYIWDFFHNFLPRSQDIVVVHDSQKECPVRGVLALYSCPAIARSVLLADVI